MEIEKQLSDARAAGDRDRIAELLVLHANELVKGGQLDQARRELDEAAKIHKEASRRVDEGRCLVFAATLCRGGGKLEQAETRARRAEKVAPTGSVPRVSAATELGEIYYLRQRFADAVPCYERALESGIGSGLTAFSQAALLRKLAQARSAAGEVAEAVPALQQARELYLSSDQPAEARKTAVELATALQALARYQELDSLVAEVRGDAEAAEDHATLADLALLDVSREIDAGAIDAALATAERALQYALSGVHPLAYTGAAIVIAELRESLGDRVGAYAALAVGWATLGDLLGEDAAKATFAPQLRKQSQRWGEAAFVEARDAYYAERRRAST